ncbi:MAG: hypothetical protein Q8S18_06955 [Bacteroidales bacterium]|nr:hypothetical protein [Bacteroidales bacterium]
MGYFYALMNVRAFLGSLSLIWVMAIPVTYPYLLQALKWQAKLEVKQKYLLGFVADELMFLEIPLWMEEKPNKHFTRIHSKEFVFDGQMYDIVEQQETDHSIWYLVYPDRKETGLKNKIARAMGMHDRQNNGKASTLDYLAKTFILFCKPLLTIQLDPNMLTDSPISHASLMHRQWAKVPDSPPPKTSFLFS